jgi:hypothetical protein
MHQANRGFQRKSNKTGKRNLLSAEERKRLDVNHQPKPLPDESIAELDRILAVAEREAEKLEV